jgi:SAM-dependent methyltransferase
VTVDDHFEQVAAVYESLRTTDEAPVRRIGQLLPDRPVTGLDVGCGTGRYSRLLRALLPDGSHMARLMWASSCPRPRRWAAELLVRGVWGLGVVGFDRPALQVAAGKVTAGCEPRYRRHSSSRPLTILNGGGYQRA